MKKQAGISRLRSSFSMQREQPWLWLAGWQRQAVFRQGQKWSTETPPFRMDRKNPGPSVRDFICFAQMARVTLPERIHLVHT